MNCTNKEQETCDVEKRGCEGCYYNEKTTDENEKNIEFWEEERQKALIKGNVARAIGCELLIDNLKRFRF